MKKPAIPTLPKEPARSSFDSAVKENIEILTGKRGLKIEQLPTNANTSDLINKVNEILTLLQG